MKKKSIFFALIFSVIVMLLRITAGAETISHILITYLVDGEYGTIISGDNCYFAVNQSESGNSGAVIFSIPQTVKFTGDDGTQYRSPIVDESFGNNIMKWTYDSNNLYSGTIANAGAIYVSTIESGSNYVITFNVNDWTPSNVYYQIWDNLNDYDGWIYINVETVKSTDDQIFEYLTGNYNSPDISIGNEDIGQALTALESVEEYLGYGQSFMDQKMSEANGHIERSLPDLRNSLNRMLDFLGTSLNPLFQNETLIAIISITLMSIIIIAILRKAGD